MRVKTFTKSLYNGSKSKISLFVVAFTLIGISTLLLAKASSPSVNIESELGTVQSPAIKQSISSASNGQYVQFKSQIYYSPGGTYSDWYFNSSTGYNSLEWTFVPVQDPPASLAAAGLLHYYAYNFGLVNSTSSVGQGYAGFQSNGIFNGTQEGQAINFSIWGSNGGKSSSPLINPANTESSGYQIMYKFPWIQGHNYKFQLKDGPSGTDSGGKWWGITVTDLSTNTATFIGEERVPTTINGLSSTLWSAHTSMFGEDTHWWNSLDGTIKYTSCSSFQNSAMAAKNITANNGTILPTSLTTSTNSGQINTGSNGFKTTNCDVTVYSNTKDVQHNLGYWNPPAPNTLN